MKDLVLSLINYFNSKDLEKAFTLIHPDVVMTTFSVRTGKIATVTGKNAYSKAVRENFGETSDLKMTVQTIISEGNLASLSGYYTGTKWEVLHLKENFKVRFAAIFGFKDGLIIKHDKYLDTLELLRLSGNSVFHENNPLKINQYLELLQELEIIKR